MNEKLEAYSPALNLLKLSPFMGRASRWVVPVAATTSQFWTKKLPAKLPVKRVWGHTLCPREMRWEGQVYNITKCSFVTIRPASLTQPENHTISQHPWCALPPSNTMLETHPYNQNCMNRPMPQQEKRMYYTYTRFSLVPILPTT